MTKVQPSSLSYNVYMSDRTIGFGEFYHVYNRGVEKRNIFLDHEDFSMFCHHLYALNHEDSITNLPRQRDLKFSRKPIVKIHGFCLMNNHYHLLLEEILEGGISKFMQKLGTGYTMYFNKKYERSGALFQGKYKFKHVIADSHFDYILDYIHLNPHDEGPTFVIKKLLKYRWSSLPVYLNIAKNFSSIVSVEFFLDYFNGVQEYRNHLEKSFYSRNNLLSNAEILIDSFDEA